MALTIIYSPLLAFLLLQLGMGRRCLLELLLLLRLVASRDFFSHLYLTKMTECDVILFRYLLILSLSAVKSSLSILTNSISSLEHRIAHIESELNLLDCLELILKTFNAMVEFDGIF